MINIDQVYFFLISDFIFNADWSGELLWLALILTPFLLSWTISVTIFQIMEKIDSTEHKNNLGHRKQPQNWWSKFSDKE